MNGRTAIRYLKALSINDEVQRDAFLAAVNWSDAVRVKAAFSALSTGNSSSLVAVGADFMDGVRPRTIVGRLMGLRKLPFNTRVIRQVNGASAAWVAEGDAIAVTAGTFAADVGMQALKVAGISVTTQELLDASDAEDYVLRDLGRASVQAMDTAFADPGNAGVSNEMPASVFYGAPSVTATGDLKTDMSALIDAYGGDLSTAAIVTSSKIAMQLGLLDVGASINLAGESSFMGVPLVASDSVPEDSSGGIIGLIDQDRIALSGATTASLEVSREASIVMDSAPSMSSITPTAAQVVSLWQCNSVGLLAKITVNWRAAPDSAAYLSGVDYS